MSLEVLWGCSDSAGFGGEVDGAGGVEGVLGAPVGETPVISRTGDRKSVLMLSAVSAQGKLHFMLQQGGSVDSKVFIEFCRKLLQDDGGKVFLIVDNVSYHDSKAVRRFVAGTDGRLRIFFLPPYAPDTNPDEWVWNNVKTAQIGRKMMGVDPSE
ncbi:transposase [Frankia sp. B2]|uniref:transposase n=1 Tax=Frankia sp. B2 TaxID=2541730 RepID=UPI00141BC680|nr:transposase [Frankia sp. B2]